MAVILDANVIINLHQAGILALVHSRSECLVPWEVYEEVVERGRQVGHRDADEIADIIGENTEFPAEILPELNHLGRGEAAALSRYVERQSGAGWSEDVIVSDDRQFLRYVSRREENDQVVIRRLTTAGLIAELGLSGVLTRGQARDALERIRSRIGERDYQAAQQLLERYDDPTE